MRLNWRFIFWMVIGMTAGDLIAEAIKHHFHLFGY